MKPIKRKYKPTIVCDKCHKSIGKTKPSYKKVGEIEYRYWRCRHCSTVLVAVLFTYFVGLYIGIKVTLIDYSQFGVLATYIATPTTTVIALYCWKAKAENIIKIKKGYPEETKDISVDLNNINI